MEDHRPASGTTTFVKKVVNASDVIYSEAFKSEWLPLRTTAPDDASRRKEMGDDPTSPDEIHLVHCTFGPQVGMAWTNWSTNLPQHACTPFGVCAVWKHCPDKLSHRATIYISGRSRSSPGGEHTGKEGRPHVFCSILLRWVEGGSRCVLHAARSPLEAATTVVMR